MPDRPDQPGFAIVGTGRSGSRFIATVLQAAGIRCGHEQWWGPTGTSRTAGLDGDSSWLAVPHLDQFDGPVLHQVRHPLDVIRSLVGIRMFSDPVHRTFRWFMYAHQPGLTGDDIHDAMLWWTAWNRRCEAHAQLRYRVEDVDADLLAHIAQTAGHPLDPAAADAALGKVPNNVNSRRRAELGFDDLPAGPLRDKLASQADEYGYPL